MSVTIRMVLASDPDFVQIEMPDFKLKNISYNRYSISATLIMDDFLNAEAISEK